MDIERALKVVFMSDPREYVEAAPVLIEEISRLKKDIKDRNKVVDIIRQGLQDDINRLEEENAELKERRYVAPLIDEVTAWRNKYMELQQAVKRWEQRTEEGQKIIYRYQERLEQLQQKNAELGEELARAKRWRGDDLIHKYEALQQAVREFIKGHKKFQAGTYPFPWSALDKIQRIVEGRVRMKLPKLEPGTYHTLFAMVYISQMEDEEGSYETLYFYTPDGKKKYGEIRLFKGGGWIQGNIKGEDTE